MKPTSIFLASEFFLLFILLPVSLVIELLIWIKVGLVLVGFLYILILLKKQTHIQFRIKKNIPWKSFWLRIGITFMLVVLVTTLYVWYQDRDALFFVPLNQPGLFIAILFVYTLFSVWPQEIIYRTFYFERYKPLFKNKNLFVFVNAIVFSLAHLFFKNTLVLVLTFVGGLIFGATYLNYKSTTAVSIEHALYGSWLFTVGMGEMLAFPGMES